MALLTDLFEARPFCCWKCQPDYKGFGVCKICGNKRCPHAANHRYRCTNSNEPNQNPILIEDIK